jgi:3-methyladenine DNA glycosylase AlkC
LAYKKLKYWFDVELAALLADKISTVDSSFDASSFIQQVDMKVVPLELKDRVEVIADELFEKLGNDYGSGLDVLMQILGPENQEQTGMFTNFYWLMPVAKYVEKYGLDDFEISMKATEEITKRNTGEYTIRPFIEKYPDRTMKRMVEWSRHSNFHVRRLASEGSRPRLPWASKLDQFISNPTPILPILDNLKDDPYRYVQKSVGSCVMDILKDNPHIAKDLIEGWNGGDISKERQWIIKHAVRKLVKKKDEWALAQIS